MADDPVTEIEEWRPVPGYLGYEASSLGRVRTTDRFIFTKQGNLIAHRGRVLIPDGSTPYLTVSVPLKQVKAFQPPSWCDSPLPLIILPVRTNERATFIRQLVHALVCTAFHGPRPAAGYEVAHNDGNRRNNRSDNLRWTTIAANRFDQIRHGTRLLGERANGAKLTETDVREIRRLCATDPYRGHITAIAKRFGVSRSAVQAIRDRLVWKHVSGTTNQNDMPRKHAEEAEEWRAVPNHPGYEASSLGRVRSMDRWILNKLGRKCFLPSVMLKPVVGSKKYHVLNLGPVKCRKVSVVVCTTFHGEKPSPNHQVAHWNGDIHDNRPANLRWATPKENTGDQMRHGTRPLGKRHWKSKLSDADVLAIRSSGLILRTISERYGISIGHAHNVVKGKSWKHIP